VDNAITPTTGGARPLAVECDHPAIRGAVIALGESDRRRRLALVTPMLCPMTPTAVHADGEVHETDVSSLGPGVGVGVIVQLGAAAQPALTAPSESATHAPATQLQRT
jgi:hypothetical protein